VSSLLLTDLDSLLVFDSGQFRVAVYGPDLEVARTFHLPGRAEDAVAVRPAIYAINSDVRTADRIGLPLHLINSDGRILRSFGSDGTFRPDLPLGGVTRRLAAGSPGRFWVAHRQQFVLEEWTESGNLVARIVRDAPWFEPYARRAIQRDHVDPIVMGISALGNGNALVIVSVAGRDWVEVLPEPFMRNGRPVYPVELGSGGYETVLEEIDQNAGTVVRAEQVSQEFFGAVDSDRLYAYRLQSPGIPRVEVWRIINRGG
jgi:hypothetical protein